MSTRSKLEEPALCINGEGEFDAESATGMTASRASREVEPHLAHGIRPRGCPRGYKVGGSDGDELGPALLWFVTVTRISTQIGVITDLALLTYGLQPEHALRATRNANGTCF